MGALGSLSIELNLNAAKFTSDLYRAEKSMRQFAKTSEDNLSQVERCVKNLHDRASLLTKLGLASAATNLGSQFLTVADNATELSNRLKLVTDTESYTA